MPATDLQCLGFIMDGNRRWAKRHNLPTYEGHRKGGEVFLESMQWVRDAGIPHVVYYGFSTENWRRSSDEVEGMMNIFREMLRQVEAKLEEERTQNGGEPPIRVKIIGTRDDFPADIRDWMTRLEQRSLEQEGAKTTIWIALSYGGRAEIVEAVNDAVRNGEMVDETSFAKLLWTADMPDPDLIVRTGGEQRLSNFLTWRSVYSELLFIDTYWPALTKDDFVDILNTYAKRERRLGA